MSEVGLLSSALPGTLVRSGLKVEQPGLELMLRWYASMASGSAVCQATILVPIMYFWIL